MAETPRRRRTANSRAKQRQDRTPKSEQEPERRPEQDPAPGAPAPHESSAGDAERLQAVRDRLYSRTAPYAERRRTPLAPAAHVVADAALASRPAAKPAPSAPPAETPPTSAMPPLRHTRGFRAKILFVGLVFFVVALVFSSVFLFFGQNTISGNNIEVAVDAPFAIGGGDVLELVIAVSNRNSVPVESATLVVEYPPGTQSAAEEGRELFRDRIPLDRIRSGETLTVPVEARLYGEENEEKVVNVSVEYRVEGSNALFYKEAEPIRIKVGSSPVVLSVDALEEVSSGQEFTLTLTVASNARTPLANVLVEAAYPHGFDFSESEPDPVRNRTMWRIDTLEPETEETITITGVMTGGTSEARTFEFSVGVPSERDPFALASVFTTTSVEVALTDPFVGLEVRVNDSAAETVSVGPDETVSVDISFENTLSDTIYDASIVAALAGNGLDSSSVQAPQGHFSSAANTITWTAQEVPSLRELTPGERQSVRFSIRGANLDVVRTPQIRFDVSVRGRRVSERNVPQELTSAQSRTIRFQSLASLSSALLYSTGPFQNTGPVPPVAESPTTYTMTLRAENGSNELADATVTATLPQYVTWLGTVSTGSDVRYNTATREVTWYLGDVDARVQENAAFQVSFLPSAGQVGTVPTLVGQQSLRATDRFTGSVVRATAPAVTTRLSQDPDPDTHDGRVQPAD